MKYFLISILFMTCGGVTQNDRLQKIWETEPIMATPESVLPHPQKDLLFVSLIDGDGWQEDGQGGIATLKADGSAYDSTWFTGLNAPKGMALLNGNLYVADIHSVAVISTENAQLVKTIQVPGATGLNDVTASDDGIVYVSDMKQGTVWRIENDTPALYLENLESINGLKCVGDELYMGVGKQFVRADAQKNQQVLGELPLSIDGIEPVDDHQFLLSAWNGELYLWNKDGSFETLLQTQKMNKNVADIGYDAAKKTVYVPTFKGNSVAAYTLQPKN